MRLVYGLIPKPTDAQPNPPACPLLHSSVDAQVADSVSSVSIVQTYLNSFSSPIQADFTWPLAAGSVLNRVQVEVGNRVISAKVMEKKAAKATYDDAVSKGHGAVLVKEDEQSEDVFSTKVGNIPPNVIVKVFLRIVMEVRMEGDQIRLVLPSHVGPRYGFLSHGSHVAVPSSVHEHPYLRCTDVRRRAPKGKRLAQWRCDRCGRHSNTDVPAYACTASDCRFRCCVKCVEGPMRAVMKKRRKLETTTSTTSTTTSTASVVKRSSAAAKPSPSVVYTPESTFTCPLPLDDVDFDINSVSRPCPPPAPPSGGSFSATKCGLAVSVTFQMPTPITQVEPVSHPNTAIVSIGSNNGPPMAVPAPETPSDGAGAGAGAGAPLTEAGVVAGAGTDACCATVKLGDLGMGLQDDVVIKVSQAQPHQPRVWVEHYEPDAPTTADDDADADAHAKSGRVAVMAALYPDLSSLTPDNDQLNEYWFVVDRSGSMGGARMTSAKTTLQLCLRSLPPGSLFQILSFGTRFSTLFPDGPKEYDDESLALATDHVDSFSANHGGTNILHPLSMIDATPPRNDRPRQVFLITDGEVKDTRAVIDQAGRMFEATSTRFFTFGVGRSVSTALVHGVAKSGGGASELITDGEGSEASAKVLRQLGRSLQPTLTNIHVDWGTLSNEMDVRCPSGKMKPLYDKTRAMVFGILKPGALGRIGEGPFTAAIKADTPDGTTEWPVSFSLATNINAARATSATPINIVWGRAIHSLAVRSRIRELETADAGGADNKAEMVALAVEFGVACKVASFVAVETRSAEEIAAAAAAGAGSDKMVSTTIGPCSIKSKPVHIPAPAPTPTPTLGGGRRYARARSSGARGGGSFSGSVSTTSRSSAMAMLKKKKMAERQQARAQAATTMLAARAAMPPPPPSAFAPMASSVSEVCDVMDEVAGMSMSQGDDLADELAALEFDDSENSEDEDDSSDDDVGKATSFRYLKAQKNKAEAERKDDKVDVEREKRDSRKGRMVMKPKSMKNKSKSGPAFNSLALPVPSAPSAPSAPSSSLSRGGGGGGRAAAPAVPALSSDDPVMAVVRLQKASGEFPGTADVACVLGVTEDAAKAACPEGVDFGAFMTAIAIAFLRTNLAGRKDEWALVEGKAVRFLRKSVGAANVDATMEAATALLSKA